MDKAHVAKEDEEWREAVGVGEPHRKVADANEYHCLQPMKRLKLLSLVEYILEISWLVR